MFELPPPSCFIHSLKLIKTATSSLKIGPLGPQREMNHLPTNDVSGSDLLNFQGLIKNGENIGDGLIPVTDPSDETMFTLLKSTMSWIGKSS